MKRRKAGIRMADGSIVRFKNGKRYQYEPITSPLPPQEKPLKKLLACLKCGVKFNTTLNIRICKKCKHKPDLRSEPDKEATSLNVIDGQGNYRGNTDADSE